MKKTKKDLRTKKWSPTRTKVGPAKRKYQVTSKHLVRKILSRFDVRWTTSDGGWYTSQTVTSGTFMLNAEVQRVHVLPSDSGWVVAQSSSESGFTAFIAPPISVNLKNLERTLSHLLTAPQDKAREILGEDLWQEIAETKATEIDV